MFPFGVDVGLAIRKIMYPSSLVRLQSNGEVGNQIYAKWFWYSKSTLAVSGTKNCYTTNVTLEAGVPPANTTSGHYQTLWILSIKWLCCMRTLSSPNCYLRQGTASNNWSESRFWIEKFGISNLKQNWISLSLQKKINPSKNMASRTFFFKALLKESYLRVLPLSTSKKLQKVLLGSKSRSNILV